MCDVSVLVPVYNVKTYLRECLDSLAAQTLEHIELVCIDDGSTDGSSEILDEYAGRDARFRVIHKENSGYGRSMNIGLQAAHGKYVGIVESDDFADADMFARLFEAAENAQAEVVKSNFFNFDSDGDVFQELLHGCPYRKICSARDVPQLLQRDTYVWTSIYRKDFLAQNDIRFNETPGASYQDVAFTLKVNVCCKRMFLLPEGFLHYRVDNMGASVRQIRQKYFCFHDEFAEYWRFLRGRDQEEQKTGSPASYHMWRMYRRNCWPCVPWREKVRYLEHVIQEFRQLEKEGHLRASDWPAEAWSNVQRLLRDPEGALFQTAQDSQGKILLAAGFWKCLRENPKVYLYGAGQVAEYLIGEIAQHDCSVAGIIVSRQDGNPESIADVPVHMMLEAPADPAHDLVIIAVTPRKPEVQQEIFTSLVHAGYRNVIVLTKELQQALR